MRLSQLYPPQTKNPSSESLQTSTNLGPRIDPTRKTQCTCLRVPIIGLFKGQIKGNHIVGSPILRQTHLPVATANEGRPNQQWQKGQLTQQGKLKERRNNGTIKHGKPELKKEHKGKPRQNGKKRSALIWQGHPVRCVKELPEGLS